MMANRPIRMRSVLLAGTALAGSLLLGLAPARAQEKSYQLDLPAQPLGKSLMAFGSSTDQQIVFSEGLVGDRKAPPLRGDYTATQALALLLEDSGLAAHRNADGVVMIDRINADPQSGSAAGDGADGTVEALIVTAQKREEDIQDVPIAISAFTQETLERSQVAGGPDLMTQVPNMTFTKTNFSSYSIQIRGIGTQAISATVDPAVAVAFNNTPFVRNRFFEQEFYDLQRVEVLRGPQGTLYGRNATAGVVNIISAKPRFNYEAKLSGDVANYKSTRLEGMINIPLVEDKVALRLAGAWTKRDGYVENQITGNPIDGRDLWSTRLSLRIAPTDAVDVNLIWEHFQEDDDRLRSGKQLCKTHEITSFGGVPTTHYQLLPGTGFALLLDGVQANWSQGCAPSSLYSPDSFQTPNGISLPYYVPLGAVFLPVALEDPYLSRTQSHDLRVIESTVDPHYRAKSDLAEVQVSIDVGAGLTLSSETSYNNDFLFSTQDFNRFNTAPGAFSQAGYDSIFSPQHRENVLNDGVFCDPQIGCTDRLVAVDLSTAKSRQFSQEFRLSSDFDGPFNFSLGANFLRYDTEDKYYVFINSLSLIAAISPYGRVLELPAWDPASSTNIECMTAGYLPGSPSHVYQVPGCTFVDPNPIESLNDQGHNYFLSKNPYKLVSYAVFGESYYQIADNLKLTGGLRFTVDKKEAPRIPTWLLAGQSVGFPVAEVIEQEWREPTGRIAIDWQPDLAFTDQTLLYASYAHGYKAGGANPPGMVNVYYASGAAAKASTDQSATRPKTFEGEFVNAFELGAKNTFLDGAVTANLAAFYYDYEGYQISQIVDRSAFNYNFDAEVWGLEIEADWRPLENLRLGFKGGYENTRVANGMKAVDLMDRTAGDPNWTIARPFPTASSNCILPVALFVGVNNDPNSPGYAGPYLHTLGGRGGGNPGPCELAYQFNLDPLTARPYVPNPPIVMDGGADRFLGDYPGVYPGFNPETAPNHGEGIDKDLSGNELPNAPHFTATITADYTIPLPHEWLATLHTDLYYQSEAWTRIFNMEGYDKLKAYTNVNLAAIFTNEDAGWKVMAYVKNVFDRDSITGAFLNSDDTGLTTNVFLTEPRLYGIRVTKDWTGGPLLGSFGQRRDGPYPITIELGGQIQRHDAPNEVFRPLGQDQFAAPIDASVKQSGDLDWGDGRDVRITYAPSASDWRLSLGARFGKTNGGGRTLLEGERQRFCVFGGEGCGAEPAQLKYVGDYDISRLADSEDHVLVDFQVGREMGVGLGGLAASTLSAGLRYADFGSSTDLRLYGTPDVETQSSPTVLRHHEYDATLRADRDFKGAGPVVSWEASRQLIGDHDWGQVDLDWSLSGGVLFGKQKTAGGGAESMAFFDQAYAVFPPEPIESSSSSFVFQRSRSVTVPTLGASLGLAYKIDRFNLGAGYRWERYFDVVDGGIDEREKNDRTIDGPYLKVSVGFGG